MGIFTMDVGRTLNAFTEGTYGVEDSLFEFLDNSEVANANNVRIYARPGGPEGLNKIIIADDGDGMTAVELVAALVFAGVIRIRAPHEISEFGVGMKAAAFALAKKFVLISRDSEGNLSGAYLNLDRIALEGHFYQDPTEKNPTYNYEELWSEFAIDPNTSGTIIYLEEITQSKYATSASFIAGIRNPSLLALRYRALIDSGSLVITTQNGHKGVPTVLPSYDPLYRHDSKKSEILFDQSFVYTPKKSLHGPVNFNFTMTRLSEDERTGSNFGIYVKVAGVVIYRDKDVLLGLYKADASHSYHWGLRGEIDFATKTEFLKVMTFTSHKHAATVTSESFTDWLRDSAIGKAYTAEFVRRADFRAAEDIINNRCKVTEENDKFVEALRERKEVYGSSRSFLTYLGKIKGIQGGRFSNPRDFAEFSGGIIKYNTGNTTIATLVNDDKPINKMARTAARALATANALRVDLENKGVTVTIDEYESFVSNMITII
tara:strand:+ start:172 stop:1641 length:1470 start_codon:yes stop_codon:yes gene_type:complete